MAEQGVPRRGSAQDPDARAATTDRMRAEIDAGLTGDKVAYPDPAAAPLGTDAEAGGAPPSQRNVASSLEQERASRTVRDQSPARDASYGSSTIALAVLVAAVAIVAIAAIWVMT